MRKNENFAIFGAYYLKMPKLTHKSYYGIWNYASFLTISAHGIHGRLLASKIFGSEYWIFVNICPSKFQISADGKTWGCKPKCQNTPKIWFFRILKENPWDLAPKSKKINKNTLRRWQKRNTLTSKCYLQCPKNTMIFDQQPISQPTYSYM